MGKLLDMLAVLAPGGRLATVGGGGRPAGSAEQGRHGGHDRDRG